MEPLSSARAASDTRHRIAAANSQPRRIKLVGLGSGGVFGVRAQMRLAHGSPGGRGAMHRSEIGV